MKVFSDIQQHNNVTIQLFTKLIADNQIEITYRCGKQKVVVTHNFNSAEEQLNIKELIPDCAVNCQITGDGSVTIQECAANINLKIDASGSIANTTDLACNRLQLGAERILLQHNITVNRSCVLSYNKKLSNYSKLQVGTNLGCKAARDSLLNNYGVISVNEDVIINNDETDNDIINVTNRGLIYAGKDLHINARKLYNYGGILSGSEIICFGKQLINLGVIFGDKQVGLDSRGDLINQEHGFISSNGDINLFRSRYGTSIKKLSVANNLINYGKVQAKRNLMVDNTNGIISNQEGGLLEGKKIDIGGKEFLNAGKLIGTQKIDVTLSHDVGRWYNKDTGVVETKKLDCMFARLVNSGVIHAQKEFTALLNNRLKNKENGKIISEANIRLTALKKIINNCLIQAKQKMHLDCDKTVVSESGQLLANKLKLYAEQVITDGEITANVCSIIAACCYNLPEGQITAKSLKLRIEQQLYNQGLLTANSASIYGAKQIINEGVIRAKDLRLSTNALHNLYSAIIESVANLVITADELQNAGIIEAYEQLKLKIRSCVDNLEHGHINSLKDLIIEAGGIIKNAGFINADAQALIKLGDTLINEPTGVITANNFDLSGGWKLDNYGSILGQSKLQLDIGTIINNYQSGTILGEQALTVISNSLNNHGKITANNLNLFLENILENYQTGNIEASYALNLVGAKLILNAGEIISENSINTKAIEVLENLKTGKINAQAGLNIIATLLVENNGVLTGNKLKLAASQLLLNGKLHSKQLSATAEHITGNGTINGGAVDLTADLLQLDGQLAASTLNIEVKNYLQLLKNGSITCTEASKLITQAGFVNLGKILNHDKLLIVAKEVFHEQDATLEARGALYIHAIDCYLAGKVKASQDLFLLVANDFEYNSLQLTADGQLHLTLKDGSQIKHDINTIGDLKLEFLTKEGTWYNEQQLKCGGTLTLDLPGLVFVNGKCAVDATLQAKTLNIDAKTASTGCGITKAHDVKVKAKAGITVHKHGELKTHNLTLHTAQGAIEPQQRLKAAGDIALLATSQGQLTYAITDATGAIKQFKPNVVTNADGADALATIYKLAGTKEVGWAARIKASRQLKEHIKEPTVRKLVMEEIKAALLSAPDVASLATIGFKLTAEEMELLGYYKLAHSSSQTSASDQKLLEEELQELVASKLLMYLDCAIEKSKFWFGLAAGSSGIMGAVAHINHINFNIFTDTNGQSEQAEITKLCTYNTRPKAPIHNIYVTATKPGYQFAVLTEVIANENPTSSTVDVEQPITAKTVKVVADGKITVTSQIEAEADNLIQSLCSDVELKSLKARRGNHDNFDDYILIQARVAAGKLLSISGINVILQKAETASGEAGTHVQALANILDIPVDLLSQRVQHFYEKRKSGHIRDTYLRQQTSLHQSTGNFNSFAGNYSSYYAPTIEAQEASIASVNDTTLFADVHDRHEHHEDIRTKKKRWYGGSKKTHKQSSSVQATSQGTRFKVKKLKVSGANVELRYVHSGAEHNLFAAPNGKVSILQGENRVAGVNIFTSSEPLWQKQSSRQENHTTYSVSTFTGTIEIDAKSAELEVVCGRVLDFLNQITLKPEDTIYKTLYEHHEVHSESKEGPGPALIALVALAVTLATHGTASGWATTLLSGATTGPMHAALAAGFQSIMAQAASVIVANNGDLEQALKDLCQKDTLKKLATSMLSAGLMDKVASGLDLPKTAITRSMSQNAAYNLTKATVDAGLAAGISGKDFAKALQENLINAAFATLGNKIDLLTNISEDHNTLLHAMLGITRSTVNKDGWLVGMIESIISARLPKYIEKLKLKRQIKEQLDSEKLDQQRATTNKSKKIGQQEQKIREKEQLQYEQAELLDNMKRHLDLQNKIAVETTGTGFDLETALATIETKINGMTREQIKEVSLALDTAKQKDLFVGDSVTLQPACAQLLLPMARIFGAPILAYLISKAGKDTYEIFKNRADIQTPPPLLFSKKHKAGKEDKKPSKPSDAAKEREKNKAKGIPESMLGPSGKPKIHVPEHPTKKRAEDAAVDSGVRGKPPEHHVNPVEGDPHFHPSGSNSREHHSYPGRTPKYHPPKKRDY